ncbi:MAG: Fic family protein, partial [Gammaproteobacteria bacterium]
MKVPLSPPSLAELLPRLGAKELPQVLSRGLGPLVDGLYFHWDELRHRTPPEGLSHEAWWAGVK